MRAAYALLALALVAGCRSDGEPAASPSPTATVTPTVEPTTPSPSASPTPTPIPTTPVATTPPARSYDYVFPIQGCTASYGRSHHDYPATDVFAAKGCAYVAPVAGRVDEVTYADRWSSSTNRGADRGGLSVSIVGVDGVRYYGSHLSRIAPGIRPGVTVKAGARLGDVGNTGSARGIATHVHFGLSWPTRPGVWWVRRGVVYPWRYLDSWRAGGDRSPRVEVLAARRAAGTDVPPCTRLC